MTLEELARDDDIILFDDLPRQLVDVVAQRAICDWEDVLVIYVSQVY